MSEPFDPVQIQMILESYREQIGLLWKLGGLIASAETAAVVYLFKKLMECQSQISDVKRQRRRKEELR